MWMVSWVQHKKFLFEVLTNKIISHVMRKTKPNQKKNFLSVPKNRCNCTAVYINKIYTFSTNKIISQNIQ